MKDGSLLRNEVSMRSAGKGQRGPIDHERREQILNAANEHFRHYGYKKTTVADLAKAIGLSTAYIYKFFESKRAIGEEICRQCHDRVMADVKDVVTTDKPASERLRLIFLTLARDGIDLLFNDRKMHDIVLAALEEGWSTASDFDAELLSYVRSVITDGRDSGEFERKTPLEEACRGVILALQPVRHPVLLEFNHNTLMEDASLLAGLVLRSLSA
ncbi:TetR/AcrR family transcriptional regulator [Komagataeibacter medellinensis]|nr:TetR/AcrR family transcriptional regulator [Komagataeibacter medellinensis]